MKKRFDYPNLGLGLGLRSVHYPYILENKPELGWFEIISENFMESGGRPIHTLEQIGEHYPIVMHGVSMSIGSTDELNMDYMKKLKTLRDRIGARWVSDHLCWTGVAGQNMHDLLPLPYTDESLKQTVEKIKQAQDYLEAPMLIENPSSYLEFNSSTMHEADFIRHMAEEADCALLLDVNNVYVSSFNHDLDPFEYLDKIPHERVVQYHLAGHSTFETHLLDTHDNYVIGKVWELLKSSYERIEGGASVMVEWDDDIPEFEVVRAEVLKAQEHIGTAEVS